MKKKVDMAELLAPLALACKSQTSCNSCKLSFGGGRCRLRFASPAAAMASVLKQGEEAVLWVRFKNRNVVLENLEFFDGLKEFSCDDSLKIVVRLYSKEDNSIFTIHRHFGDDAIDAATARFPPEDVKLTM